MSPHKQSHQQQRPPASANNAGPRRLQTPATARRRLQQQQQQRPPPPPQGPPPSSNTPSSKPPRNSRPSLSSVTVAFPTHPSSSSASQPPSTDLFVEQLPKPTPPTTTDPAFYQPFRSWSSAFGDKYSSFFKSVYHEGPSSVVNAEHRAGSGANTARSRRQTRSRRESAGGNGLERVSSMHRTPIMRKPGAAPPLARQDATTFREVGRPKVVQFDPMQPSKITDKPGGVVVIVPVDGNADDGGALKAEDEQSGDEEIGWWTTLSWYLTCCFPTWFLSRMGKSDRATQQAWREKVASCIIIFSLMACVAFVTFGLPSLLCPGNDGFPASDSVLSQADHLTIQYRSDVIMNGYIYDFNETASLLYSKAGITLTPEFYGADLTTLFKPSRDACERFYPSPRTVACVAYSRYGSPLNGAISGPLGCPDSTLLQALIPKGRAFFTWEDVRSNIKRPHTLLVFNGAVLNLTTYFDSQLTILPLNLVSRFIGRDSTLGLSFSYESLAGAYCLQQQFTVGHVDRETLGCTANSAIQAVILMVVMGVILVRFVMAVAFHWFISERLVRRKVRSLRKGRYRYAIPAPPKPQYTGGPRVPSMDGARGGSLQVSNNMGRRTSLDDDPYVMMLVTCYSEGPDGIRSTLESLSSTDYPDSHKLLFVIADGLITGSGNSMSTPEAVLSMMRRENGVEPERMSYLAIADGAKQHNMAKVYFGYYDHRLGGSVPMIAIVKCGSIEEESESGQRRSGNRGKRDSQLILMNFLSRVMFDDRMTPLDYAVYSGIKKVAGVDPHMYDLVLMVDADTVVEVDSLYFMVQAMKNDSQIMGLCGETRIANKRDTWVTKIQVFEYYISHHLGKAFESVFGGVTCLPGCFCMYRIKGRRWAEDAKKQVLPGCKGDELIPILANPYIVEEYSENIVDTLHKKNLLSLGEDRFLTTLMLRTFPKRKMIFVPQAICRTVVPDQFRMLLSQRRRWINSTIHNLLELVLLRDLCGIFCFSMQFMVALDLIGTVILPAAITFVFILIFSAIFTAKVAVLPLLMLLATLGLPGVLIVITTRKMVYVLWMLIYLVSLPVWNFVLPLYAFWHFDDFTWGETRKVEGETKQGDHSKRHGEYIPGTVRLKTYLEWEEDRIIAQSSHSVLISDSIINPPGDPTMRSVLSVPPKDPPPPSEPYESVHDIVKSLESEMGPEANSKRSRLMLDGSFSSRSLSHSQSELSINSAYSAKSVTVDKAPKVHISEGPQKDYDDEVSEKELLPSLEHLGASTGFASATVANEQRSNGPFGGGVGMTDAYRNGWQNSTAGHHHQQSAANQYGYGYPSSYHNQSLDVSGGGYILDARYSSIPPTGYSHSYPTPQMPMLDATGRSYSNESWGYDSSGAYQSQPHHHHQMQQPQVYQQDYNVYDHHNYNQNPSILPTSVGPYPNYEPQHHRQGTYSAPQTSHSAVAAETAKHSPCHRNSQSIVSGILSPLQLPEAYAQSREDERSKTTESTQGGKVTKWWGVAPTERRLVLKESRSLSEPQNVRQERHEAAMASSKGTSSAVVSERGVYEAKDRRPASLDLWNTSTASTVPQAQTNIAKAASGTTLPSTSSEDAANKIKRKPVPGKPSGDQSILKTGSSYSSQSLPPIQSTSSASASKLHFSKDSVVEKDLRQNLPPKAVLSSSQKPPLAKPTVHNSRSVKVQSQTGDKNADFDKSLPVIPAKELKLNSHSMPRGAILDLSLSAIQNRSSTIDEDTTKQLDVTWEIRDSSGFDSGGEEDAANIPHMDEDEFVDCPNAPASSGRPSLEGLDTVKPMGSFSLSPVRPSSKTNSSKALNEFSFGDAPVLTSTPTLSPRLSPAKSMIHQPTKVLKTSEASETKTAVPSPPSVTKPENCDLEYEIDYEESVMSATAPSSPQKRGSGLFGGLPVNAFEDKEELSEGSFEVTVEVSGPKSFPEAPGLKRKSQASNQPEHRNEERDERKDSFLIVVDEEAPRMSAMDSWKGYKAQDILLFDPLESHKNKNVPSKQIPPRRDFAQHEQHLNQRRVILKETVKNNQTVEQGGRNQHSNKMRKHVISQPPESVKSDNNSKKNLAGPRPSPFEAKSMR
ncbi:Chitin synthase, class 3 [Chytridiales sp. JEL 0842]|nr:Chitin synthase, class 3 [Chytridiales sp. JEL 0842]